MWTLHFHTLTWFILLNNRGKVEIICFINGFWDGLPLLEMILCKCSVVFPSTGSFIAAVHLLLLITKPFQPEALPFKLHCLPAYGYWCLQYLPDHWAQAWARLGSIQMTGISGPVSWLSPVLQLTMHVCSLWLGKAGETNHASPLPRHSSHPWREVGQRFQVCTLTYCRFTHLAISAHIILFVPPITMTFSTCH